MAKPEAARAKTKTSNTLLSFPTKPLAHSILIIFKDYSYSNIDSYNNLTATAFSTRTANERANQLVQLRSSTAIELPFPRTLTDEYGLKINGFERDAVMEYITSGLAGAFNGKNVTVGDLPGMAKEKISAVAGSIQEMGRSAARGEMGGKLKGVIDQISKSSANDAARAAAYLLRSYIPGVERTAALVTGQTVNPRETLAFEGVNLKSFSFNWQLFPNSKADSDRIKAIVSLIKSKALPETEDLLGFNRVFLKYPSIVEIQLLGVDPTHFMRFKPAMITGFNVDYGTGGTIPIAEQGRPAVVNLSMNFSELQIRTADDEIEKRGTVTIDSFGTTEGE